MADNIVMPELTWTEVEAALTRALNGPREEERATARAQYEEAERERRRLKTQGHRTVSSHPMLGHAAWLRTYLTGDHVRIWQTQDLQPAGACGNASAADAKRGAELVERAAKQLIVLIDEVARFPLESITSQTRYSGK